MKSPHSIRNLKDIHQEQHRITKELELCESELKQLGSYFHKHHKKMLWYYLNPFGKQKKESIPAEITTTSNVFQEQQERETERMEKTQTTLVLIAVKSVKKWLKKRNAPVIELSDSNEMSTAKKSEESPTDVN